MVALASLSATVLPGCVTVSNYKQELFGLDKSTRESTGYYEYQEATLKRNTIVVPDNLDNPGQNQELQVKTRNLDDLNGKLGEEVDVRPPTAPYRSDLGCHSQWVGGEAIVWFDPRGTHGINTEDDAWMLIDATLRRASIGVAQIGQGQYVLTTLPRDFNEYATPYTADDEELGLLKYSQTYQMRVGRNNFGEIGIATKILSSATRLSNDTNMEDLLTLVEQERFAMGLSNLVVHELDVRHEISEYDPDHLVITLGRDNNNHDAILVEAPFDTTSKILASAFGKVGWSIKSHSVEKAQFEVEVLDSDDDIFGFSNARALPINHGTYKIRIGLHQNVCAITIYDKEDRPLKSEVMANIYPGFAEVLQEEFSQINAASAVEIKAK